MEYKFSTRNRGTRRSPNWQLILSYKDLDGKWRQKSKSKFPSKASITEKDKNTLLKSVTLHCKVPANFKNITIRQLWEDYERDNYTNAGRAFNTVITYTNLLKYSGLYNRPIIALTPLEIQSTILSSHHANKTKKYILQAINQLLNKAVNTYQIIEKNPANNIQLRLKIEKKIKFITPEEMDLVEKSLSNQKFLLVVRIARYTGMRCGEINGLKWHDIDFKNSEIHVKRQFGRISIRSLGVMPLKTGNSKRIIPIPPILLNYLRAAYRQQKILNINDMLFPKSIRGINVYIKKICGKSMHCYRHSYATHLLAQGLDIQTVAALLGDTPSTVVNTYIHYSDEMRNKAAKDVARIFG